MSQHISGMAPTTQPHSADPVISSSLSDNVSKSSDSLFATAPPTQPEAQPRQDPGAQLIPVLDVTNPVEIPTVELVGILNRPLAREDAAWTEDKLSPEYRTQQSLKRG